MVQIKLSPTIGIYMTNESLAKEALRLHIIMLSNVFNIHHGMVLNELCGIHCKNVDLFPSYGMIKNMQKLNLVEIVNNEIVATRLGQCFSKAFIDNGMSMPFNELTQIDKEFTW